MIFNDRRQGGWPRQMTQRFQIELRGRLYYVVDTINNVTVGGPFRDRTKAQADADRWERAVG